MPAETQAIQLASLGRVLEAMPDAMLVSDPLGRIVLASKHAESLLGYGRDELAGLDIESLVPERFRHAHAKHRAGYAAAPRVRPMGATSFALYARRKDGTELPVEISLSPLPTDEGLMTIAAVRDISERLRIEQQRADLAQAREAVRLRDEFVAVASHEIKTPLAALAMQIDYLTTAALKKPDELLPERVAQRLRSVHRLVHRLASLIDQLLDVSRLTAGRLELERESLDLGELVRRVIDQFQPEIARAGCALALDTEPDVVGTWDPLRLEQVVSNLISNAVKYGRGKPVHVRAGALSAARAVVVVSDHGDGIAPEHQARIFDRFERNVSGRAVVGFGLGLWIARQMVEAHGGTIRLDSAPGRGATFTVELPR